MRLLYPFASLMALANAAGAKLSDQAASLEPERQPSGHDGDDGSSDRSFAEHEVRAAERDLGALLEMVKPPEVKP